MPTVAAILFLTFPALVIVAGLSDLTTLTIPNRVTGALALAFIPAAACALAAGAPLNDILACLAVGAAVLVIGVAMFALGWIGGGDAKLIAAACLWLGVAGTPKFLMATAISGGVFAVVVLGARRLQPLAVYGPPWVGRLMARDCKIPYGVAIAAGAVAAAAESPLWRAVGGAF